MRRSLMLVCRIAGLLTLFTGTISSLSAQGWIIPRPCTPCIIDRPCRCAPEGATIVRTASDVRAELVNGVIRYEITETFVNRGGGLGEADYLFPLPKGAAFQDLKLSINGELVSGEAMNADQARGIYEEIVRRQRDPALVEWMGYGLLRARIFPINAGESKKVVVRYQAVATREGDALRIDYFRGSAPNGASSINGVSGAQRDDNGTTSFTFTYPDDWQYGVAYSPTHEVHVTSMGERRRVTVTGDAQDVTLLLPVRRSTGAAITVLPYATGKGDGFAMISLSPPRMNGASTPRDVTVVIDVSGSMSGTKLEQAKAAAGQRAAMSLAAVDSLSGITTSANTSDGNGATRRSGAHLLTLQNGIWTDARPRGKLKAVTVKPFSDAYFKLADAIPELRTLLAIGDRVQVVGRAVVIIVAPTGVERLSPRELDAIQAQW